METILIKLGGSVLEKHKLLEELATEIRQLQHKVAIIHGGGPVITKVFEAFGKENRFVNGLRATSDETIDLVEMSLSGQVNKSLTRRFLAAGLPAVGISGTDGKLFQAEPISSNDPQYNRVGKVTKTNSRLIETLWQAHWLPVISPLGITSGGNALNINADSAAYALAQALQANALIFLTDVPGILWEGQVLQKLTPSLLKIGIQNGIIRTGMLPKLEQGFAALQSGVRTIISTWQGQNTISKLLSGSKITFTELVRDS